MARLGKADQGLFESVIYPNRGTIRGDVVIGPQQGVDFGVVDVNGSAVVVSTDPVSVLPELGFYEAGRFALEFVLADVAVSGIAPTHLTVSFTLPSQMTDAEFEDTWTGVSDHARDLGVSVVAGHTAWYSGVSFPWIGSGTAFGVGDYDALVRPDGAQPGDMIVFSGVPAGEVAGLFSTVFPEQIEVPGGVRERAMDRLGEIETVRDALCVTSGSGVSAVHDVTEGGVIAGLVELAASSGTHFEVDSSMITIPPDVQSVCDAIKVDPLCVTSAGSLLITVPMEKASGVVADLESRGTPAWIIGRVTEGSGVRVDGNAVLYPEVDLSWEAFRRFTDAT